MTHTSTEQQPEALRLVEMYDFGDPATQGNAWKSAVCTELCYLHTRVQKLEAERDEADRRAGCAERRMAGLNDVVRRFEAARHRMKVQWGVPENVSFDVVWQQALDAKASQAQHVPLSDDLEKLAIGRYKVVPSHESLFHRWAVVAGDGKQQLYAGREIECMNMAQKFMGAFLDGAFVVAHGITQEK